MCKAKTLGYFDIESERHVNEVKEAGNFVSHYGQRYEREVDKAFLGQITVSFYLKMKSTSSQRG